MKKNFLSFFMILMFAIPAFATDPDIDTATASCDDGVFNSNSGPVNIEVNWEPNEINLRWYNNNTLITPSDSASNTCTYDENGLTIPAAPTRTGYTFRGWRACPQYDFSQLPTNQDGTEHWAKAYYNDEKCQHDASSNALGSDQSCSNLDAFKELERYEWRAKFPWGDIYGSANCSAKIGDSASGYWNNDSSNWLATYDELTSASGTKQYCWCKATGYKPSDSSTLYRPISAPSSSVWVYCRDRGTAASCNRYCAANCALYLRRENNFRRILLGQ